MRLFLSILIVAVLFGIFFFVVESHQETVKFTQPQPVMHTPPPPGYPMYQNIQFADQGVVVP